MATTESTAIELEIELTMRSSSDAQDVQTRKITLRDPITSAAGISAIQSFNAWLTTTSTAEAAGIVPNRFFQPGETNTYITDAADARIIETTKRITTID